MRLYIDLSCFNRPFDDQRQERIRRETEATFSVLTRIMDGKDTFLWSWVMTFENDKHPNPERRDEIAIWESRSERSIALSNEIEERARQIVRSGISGLDALHLASAEEGGANIMLTCDDVLVRRSKRLTLALRVLNPVAYFEEVEASG